MQHQIATKLAELQQDAGVDVQVEPLTYAQALIKPPFDGLAQADAQRKAHAEKLSNLIKTREQLDAQYPALPHLEAAIAEMKQRGEDTTKASPGQLLDQAMLLTAKLQVKHQKAHAQMQKDQDTWSAQSQS